MPRRLLSIPLAAAAVFSSSAMAIPAHATVPTAVYVSSTGSGTACTAATPCNVDAALAAHGKADYKFLPGQYRRTTPIILTPANAGSTLEASSTSATVIDGSMQVTGFTVFNKNGIMRAPIPKGLVARTLFINDTPATLASASATSILGQITNNNDGTFTTANSTSLLGSSAELQWSGPNTSTQAYELWVDRKVDVTVTGDKTLTTVGTQWADQAAVPAPATIPSNIANTLAALTQPGQFVVDGANGYLYYMPRAGENLSTAQVSLPVSQSLLVANGVDNIIVKGLRFTKDTVADTGFADVQATVHQVNGVLAALSGAINFTNSHGVTITQSSVDRTGGAGINMAGGASNHTLTNNYIQITGGSGIQVGDVNESATDDQNNTVTRNTITQTGTRYHSGVGIFGGVLRNSLIGNNTVSDSNYTGISLGWGWGATSNQGGNKVQHNKVTNVMQSELSDGGGIYLLNKNDPADRDDLSYNVVNGDAKPHGGIYLDGSSSNIDVHHNVVTNVATGTAWLFLQSVIGQQAIGNNAYTNYVQNAYVNADNYGGLPSVLPQNTVADARVATDPLNADSTAQAIVVAAGAAAA